MKIVVIGGSGLIGSKTVKVLRGRGHEVISASPKSGVNAVTGEGLAQALADAQVVIDVSNSPSFADQAVLDFFEKSGRNLAAAEITAGVRHHVALSVVGTDRLQASGYFRGKLAQERLIEKAGVPYTIVRATQFFEFMGAIAQASTVGTTTRLSTGAMQPMSADEVAEAMADAALGTPANGMIEIAGPERAPLSDFVARFLKATGDKRTITADAGAPYFGVVLDDTSLVPGADPRLGRTRFDDWLLRRQQAAGGELHPTGSDAIGAAAPACVTGRPVTTYMAS